ALNTLKKVSQLDHAHPAKRYVESRKIPSNIHFKLFYAPKFKAFVNSLVPDKFDSSIDEPRLIIPFVDQNQNLIGFQGRNFSNEGIRYITIMLDKDKPKVYGLESCNLKEKFYVFEGPIDSMFIKNSIAMAGSSLDKLLEPYKANAVIVYDNEPRNKEIINNIEKYVSHGYKVCVWPDGIQEKDINEMILGGKQAADIKLIIDNNTFVGLSAMIKVKTWKKV
ncbi:DNA primase, partial [bacterium]|nr:DNA primase [bacterium]